MSAKPVFIIGVGRSGSTEFHSVMSDHPHVAWLSVFSDRYPTKLHLSRKLMEAIDHPLLGARARQRFRPAECYEFWEHYCRGFRRPCRDLRADDVTLKNKRDVPRALEQILTQRRQRLLIKITGWPRVGFLQEIFPDAKFVHVVRDGRAVANSLISVDFWWGFRGPSNWRYGDLTLEQQALWEKYNRSFVALAGIQWNILMDATAKARALVDPSQFCEIKYEDYCTEPGRVFREVCDFCELEWTGEFERAVAGHTMRNANHKWREELTPEQGRILTEVTAPWLEKLGYEL
jgi:omega-hydroxy-beta-dihydromenaquinone-9 sulfotransferase